MDIAFVAIIVAGAATSVRVLKGGIWPIVICQTVGMVMLRPTVSMVQV